MACSFLYFDIGNVLLSFCQDRMCSQMAHVANLEVAGIRHILLENDGAFAVQMQFERGDLNAEEYYEFFCLQTGTRPDRTALELAGSDIFEPIETSIRLVGKLAEAGHRLGLLSNIGSVHWDFIKRDRFQPIPAAFEVQILSYQTRSVKPESDIYELAISRAGVPAAEIFFVDDRKENVSGALEVGIDAVLYTNPQQLVDDLQSRGIEP